MKKKAFTISLTGNPVINMNVIPGHFTTSHFHLSHYLDLFDLKSNAAIARNVAVELAVPYIHSTPVDTIVCMEGTEIIGAYLAEELRQSGRSVINSEREIHVVSPIYSVDKKLIFHSNVQEKIKNKNVLLLVSSISSGATIKSALECLSYYCGIVVGKSALFNAYPDQFKKEIHSLFTNKDIPNYQMYRPDECHLCSNGYPLDALIISDGYTKMNQ
ncbi:MAG: hypothetical protein GX303_06175 [Clostridiales bacterium]|nr:hypothetical protein [Clostridiales bacterium]